MPSKRSYPYVKFYYNGKVFWVRVALRGNIVGVFACDEDGRRATPPRRVVNPKHRYIAAMLPLKIFTVLNHSVILFCEAYHVDYKTLDLYT